MLIADSATLIAHDLRFDPRFRFHFYDMDFCRQAELKGLRMGTWPISVVHKSGGSYGGPAWQESYRAYLDKYGDDQTLLVGGEIAVGTNHRCWAPIGLMPAACRLVRALLMAPASVGANRACALAGCQPALLSNTCTAAGLRRLRHQVFSCGMAGMM